MSTLSQPGMISLAGGLDPIGLEVAEVDIVVANLGFLIAIGISIWLSILERRRVDAAANQLAADLRLAHTSATNILVQKYKGTRS